MTFILIPDGSINLAGKLYAISAADVSDLSGAFVQVQMRTRGLESSIKPSGDQWDQTLAYTD